MAEAKKSLSPQYQWQKERLIGGTGKPQFAGSSFSGQCYGPEGDYSLYLPSPRVTRRVVFVNGAAQVEESADLFALPGLAELRKRVQTLGQWEFSSPTMALILFSDAALAEYSAALLRVNYNLTDEDLTFLHAGRKWMEPIIIHALGGKEERDALSVLDTTAIKNAAVETEQRITRALTADLSSPGIVEGSGEDYAAVASAINSGLNVETDEELDLATD